MASSTIDENISEQIAVEEASEGVFVSRLLPQRTGNVLPIAYGGCALAYMVAAACKTVGPQYHLFSFLGSYLGPTRIDRKVYCRVTRTRDTRSFATRIVFAFQILDDGSERVCLQSSIDFHVNEAAMFTYSMSPPKAFEDGPEDESRAFRPKTVLERGIENQQISQADADHYLESFKLADLYFDTRHCASSVSAQTVLGIATQLRTPHDDLPIHQRQQVEWSRLRHALNSQHENCAALAFYMDGGLSFLPLHLNHQTLNDAAACSSMDFAFRIMSPKADLANWHLRERRTMAAEGGRTLSESWLWDHQGNIVATMSQTSIMRAPAGRNRVEKL